MPANESGQHITVDARMAGSSGIGTYIQELVPRVVDALPGVRFTLLGDLDVLPSVVGQSARVRHAAFDAPIYSIREQLAFRNVIPRDTSLFWAPHYNVPLALRCPLAVTVHDLNHLTVERSLAKRAYARRMFKRVQRRASVVFCDSTHTAQDFTARVGVPRQLVVCLLGVSSPWTDPNDQLPAAEPYFLYVGNVKPHKNLSRLITAFSEIAGSVPHRLVIAGRTEGMRTVDSSVSSSAAATDRVTVTGYVSPDQLVQLVRRCDALVLPSLAEGFGLPPLEALACGRAVGVSNVASLPEVCGPVAEYFDPLDTESISAALLRLANRPLDRAEVVERRRAWARQFDWACTARITADGLSRALASAPAMSRAATTRA